MTTTSGKVAVVTGAARGMGKEFAKALLKAGAKVALLDINKELITETCMELSKFGDAHSFICDISNRESVAKTFSQIRNQTGKIGILINNAGIVTKGSILELSEEAIIKTFEVNTLSQFWTTKAVLPGMIEQNEGHIVNISSMGALVPVPGQSAYNASKAAVSAFSDSIRQEMKKFGYNIHITIVAPYFVDTGMFDGVSTGKMKMLTPEKVVKKVMKAILKNRPFVGIPWLDANINVPSLKLYTSKNIQDKIYKMMGQWDAMDTFKGH
jgi:all-trans-retinol dehydrogenase (NAD+)